MIKKKFEIELRIVRPVDYKFLYELLSKRDPKVNISHKKMPSYQKHVKFVRSKPYSVWYIVYYNDNRIGSAYLSKQNEIGINMTKEFFNDELRKHIMNLIMKKNPRQRFLGNVSPKNKKGIRFLENNDFKLVQYTFELIDRNLS